MIDNKGVMRGYDNCAAILSRASEGSEYRGSIRAIEVAGWLIGQDDFRIIHQCATYGDSLGLATRYFSRPMLSSSFDCQQAQQLVSARHGIRASSSVVQGRLDDGIEHSPTRIKHCILENKTDHPSTNSRPGGIRQLLYCHAIEKNASAGGAQ